MKTIKNLKFAKASKTFMGLSSLKIVSVIFSLVILCLDRITKAFVVENLMYTKTYPVFSVLLGELKIGLNWFVTFNYGTAFSFIKVASGSAFYILSALSILITVVLLGWMYHEDKNNKLNIIAISTIIGGALGNIYDRLTYGFVIDFIDVYAGTWHWPVFNIADIAVSVGVIVLVYTQLIARK